MTQHSRRLIERRSDLIKIENSGGLNASKNSFTLTHFKSKAPISHFWLGLAFTGRDSDCLFAEERREGTREGKRESEEREIAYAQKRGVFSPSASSTIPS